MPMKSKAQHRYMFAAEARGELKPGTARRFAHETKNFKKLPERVKKATFEAAISITAGAQDLDAAKVAFAAGMVAGMKNKIAGITGELVGLGALAVPAAVDIAHKPKHETKVEKRMRHFRAGAELTGLGILAAHTIKNAGYVFVRGTPGAVREAEANLRDTPLGERVLADFNAKNDGLRMALASWRRMRDAGTDMSAMNGECSKDCV